MSTVSRIPLAPWPWRLGNLDRGDILDLNDRLVCRIPKAGAITADERRANQAVILHAPELLKALREAAYWLHVSGVPATPEFYDLIDRASSGMPRVPRLRDTLADSNAQDKHYIVGPAASKE